MGKVSKSKSLGVRGRLLLAFLGISMFSLAAAASGLYSLSQVSGALDKITEQRVPEALSWLELSRRVERVVRAAPALLGAGTESARAEVSAEISMQTDELSEHWQRSRGFDADGEASSSARIEELLVNMTDNLVALDELVKKRLAIVASRDKLIRQLSQSNSVAQRTLSPGARILGSQIADWNRSGEQSKSGEMLAGESEIARSIISLLPQQRATVLVDAIHNNLLTIAAADASEGIDLLLFPLNRTLNELFVIIEDLPKRAKRRLEKEVKVLVDLTDGPDSLPQVRKDELAVIAEAEQLLSVNSDLAAFLTNRIRLLVDGANAEIEEANAQAAAIERLNRNVLIGVVVLSLASSVLIVWLYVGRNLIARLTALSDSMLAIAEGNLRAPLPATSGGDEISRMAEALVVFRNTAIEVEESNLREIEEAQRRLVDAIENSSEGFAFYDPDDNLVICNARYKELLYPNADIAIEPGMPFETIIRRAAEEGHILDAEGRVDEWVAERLDVHRNPGEPRLQQRGSGQWILVTERKTGDGGNVAIYSDVTDLKQREEELTTKSNALEQLSNQLAKYLSPQVYDSIFAGKQEVKLVSQRKRLTVFFSDLVGFTETAERLESEDVTRLLNQYLTEMSEIALEHGATIDKFVGDAIVIFFGDPETLGIEEDARACVRMAVAMRKRMGELESVWKDSGLERPLRCRIGINTGVCTVGNFGSDDRMDYTIIGSGVNLAARLEAKCPPSEILISYETYAHVKDLFHCEERDAISVKGFERPVTIYQVVDLYENMGSSMQPIRAKLPHFQLDADVTLMSPNEQREALAVLLDSVERLSSFKPGA
jgi:adenylate cyclase